jgi:hypothetical protein
MMAKAKAAIGDSKKGLDKDSAKSSRGRWRTVRYSEVLGRADNYRYIFNEIWDRLWPLLSTADTEEKVVNAFRDGAAPYTSEFVPNLAALTVRALQEHTFPKRRKSQIGFLADSLAGYGVVTPRRSRDICAEERANAKRQHHILRHEYYVECSCGYKGPSRDFACRRCKAAIAFQLGPQIYP